MRKLPPMGALKHALRSTYQNLGFAFHVSWPWMLAILPFNILGNTYVTLNQPADSEEFSLAIVLVSLCVSLLTMIAFSSIAVSWHRYILLDEVPRGVARLRLDATVWRYIGNILLIIAMAAAASIPLVIVLAALGLMSGKLAAPASVIFAGAYLLGLITYAYRLSIKLPAIALGRRDYGFKLALADTAGNGWRFIGFLLLQMAIGVMAGGALAVLALGAGRSDSAIFIAVLVAIDLAINWIASIWGAAILTSFYGYFVEGREF